jgi:SpoVK/Ycf46/Vps4 family AAA+-type ATPase
MDAVQELELLIKSRYPIIYLETWEEERAEAVLRIVARNLRKSLYLWTCTQGLCRWDTQNLVYKTNQPLEALAHMASTPLAALYVMKDFHQYLEEPLILRKLKDISAHFERNGACMVIVSPVLNIPPELKRMVAHFVFTLPSKEELQKVIPEAIEEARMKARIQVSLTPEEIEQVAERLKGLTEKEAKRTIFRALLDDNRFSKEDFRHILEGKKEIIENTSVLEFYFFEETLSSVGGMENLKDWLNKRKKALGERAEKFGLEPPKGILIIGVQGCGKSHMAKTIAQDWDLPLLRLDAGKLYIKYVGESEKNLRQALTIAESMAPVVLWIDEIEKGFSYSQFSEADSGLSRRIFGTFLTWLQEKRKMVFVVATSNDLTSLPPEFLRKGRFDEIFFVDLPTREGRKEIFRIHLAKRKKNPQEFDLNLLADETKGFSGAEIEQVIISALYSAFSGSGNLTTQLILLEIANTVPLSVTMKEKIDALREWAKGRTIPAGDDFNQES